MTNKIIVVASGYFSPLHFGHVEYLQKSKTLGDILIVIVNNDNQELLKKGKSFMSAAERVKVVRALECVDIAIESIDTDRTVCKTLASLHPHIFTNGGDQFNDTIPEKVTCDEYGIKLVDGLGDKIQSSSTLIKNAEAIPDYKNPSKIVPPNMASPNMASPNPDVVVRRRTRRQCFYERSRD